VVDARIEESRLISLVQADPLVEPDLRRRLELRRQDKTGRARDALLPPERARELQEPAPFDDDVVVGERDDVTPRLAKTRVVSDREPRHRLVHVEKIHPVAVPRLDELATCGSRVVVDQDHLVARVVEREH
jgi:hypothetical protein